MVQATDWCAAERCALPLVDCFFRFSRNFISENILRLQLRYAKTECFLSGLLKVNFGQAAKSVLLALVA